MRHSLVISVFVLVICVLGFYYSALYATGKDYATTVLRDADLNQLRAAGFSIATHDQCGEATSFGSVNSLQELVSVAHRLNQNTICTGNNVGWGEEYSVYIKHCIPLVFEGMIVDGCEWSKSDRLSYVASYGAFFTLNVGGAILGCVICVMVGTGSALRISVDVREMSGFRSNLPSKEESV